MEKEAIKKKSVLRAPPRSMELDSTLNTIRVQTKVGKIRHYFFFRIILIITGIASLFIGAYILLNYNDFLEVEFKYRDFLLIYIYIYSSSGIGIMLLSFILSLVVYLFYCCCSRKRIYGAPLIEETETTTSFVDLKASDNKEDSKIKSKNNNRNDSKIMTGEKEYIGYNADKVSLLPYTLTIFVILSIFFYFMALPSSIFLIIKLWDHPYYRDKKEYWVLYVFILTNLVNGVLIATVFVHMFCVKRIENNILKKNMELDEAMIKSIRDQVRESLKRAK